MIIKMIILRLLGSSDDKDKEKIDKDKEKMTILRLLGSIDGCRKNRRHGRRESKPSHLMGTG